MYALNIWYCLPSIYSTLNIIETQLSSFVLAPSKHSSGQREGKAVVSARGDLCQRNPCQRLEGLWKQLAGLALPQSELTAGVQTPREQLAISTEKNSTVHSRTALSHEENQADQVFPTFRKCNAVLISTHHLSYSVVAQPFDQPWGGYRHLYLLGRKMRWKTTLKCVGFIFTFLPSSN